MADVTDPAHTWLYEVGYLAGRVYEYLAENEALQVPVANVLQTIAQTLHTQLQPAEYPLYERGFLEGSQDYSPGTAETEIEADLMRLLQLWKEFEQQPLGQAEEDQAAVARALGHSERATAFAALKRVGIEIGDPERQYTVEPMQPPVPMPAPAPSEPDWEPAKAPEREKEEVGAKAWYPVNDPDLPAQPNPLCPFGIEIGEPERQYTVEPMEPPVPMPAPAPSQPQPEREKEREKEKVSWHTAAEEEPELLIEPIKGRRTLYLDEELNLRSGRVGGEMLWQPGVAAVAECRKGGRSDAAPDHLPGDVHCTCGFYAVNDDNEQIMTSYTVQPYVLVELSLWGQVGKFSGGWRAQYAYPYAIQVPANMIWFDKYTSEEVAKSLRQKYQVDVEISDPPWAKRSVENMRREPVTQAFPNGWSLQENFGDTGLLIDDIATVDFFDEEKNLRAVITFTYRNRGAFAAVTSITNGDGSALEDEEAEAMVVDWVRRRRASNDVPLAWDLSSEWVRNLAFDNSAYDYGYKWELGETKLVSSLDDLVDLAHQIETYPDQFTEPTPIEHDDGLELTQDSGVEGEYGMPTIHATMYEIPPVRIDCTPAEWQDLLNSTVAWMAGGGTDESLGEVHRQKQSVGDWFGSDMTDLALAFYVVPTFMNAEANDAWQFDAERLKAFMDEAIQGAEQTAANYQNHGWVHQDEQLFDSQQYEGQPSFARNEASFFLSYLKQLASQGQGYKVEKGDPKGKKEDKHWWEHDPAQLRKNYPPQTTLTMPGTFAKRSRLVGGWRRA